MPIKNPSPYPPDRWIRELNRMHPALWTDLKKAYAAPSKLIRKGGDLMQSLRNVPDWCPMPTLFPFLTLTDKYGISYYLQYIEEIMTMGTHYLWRMSKSVYRFAPEIYDALISQPLDGDLPNECLHHLPQWAVYIETPGMTFEYHPISGFIAHLDYNLHTQCTDLQLALFSPECAMPRMIALPLGDGTLRDAMDRTEALDKALLPKDMRRYPMPKEEYKAAFTKMLQLTLYLCSEEPDITMREPPEPVPSAPRKKKAHTNEPKVWDVGYRIASVIRKCKSDEKQGANTSTETGRSLRPHVRSAHWHTYWVGPRTATFPER